MTEFTQLVRDAGGHGTVTLTEEERTRWLVAHPDRVSAPLIQSFWNTWPPNTVQVDAEEWMNRTSTNPMHTECRQPRLDKATTDTMSLIWAHDGTGTMWGRFYMPSMTPPDIYIDPTLTVQSTNQWRSAWFATFWTFAVCLHSYDVRGIRRCLHRYTCRSCGFSHEVDSSD